MTLSLTDNKTTLVTCTNCGRSGPMPDYLALDFTGKCPHCLLAHAIPSEISEAAEPLATMRLDDDGAPYVPTGEQWEDDVFPNRTKDGAHGRAATALSDGLSDADLHSEGAATSQVATAPVTRCAGSCDEPASHSDDDALGGASSSFPAVGGELSPAGVCLVITSAVTNGVSDRASLTPGHTVQRSQRNLVPLTSLDVLAARQLAFLFLSGSGRRAS